MSFDQWLAEYNVGKVAVLFKDNEYLFIRLCTRFSQEYKKRVWLNLRDLAAVEFQHHLILEVNPNCFLNFRREFDFINKAWAKLRAWLFKNYGHFEFLRIMETHKSLRPHLHVLISGIPYIDYKRLYREWNLKLKGGFVYRKSIENNFNALYYVLKYVNKMVCVQDDKNRYDRLFSAVMFATNKRLFTLSRGLRSFMGLKKDVSKVSKGYTYLGCRRFLDLSIYLLDKGLSDSGRVFRVKPTTEDLYDNMLLFFVGDDG